MSHPVNTAFPPVSQHSPLNRDSEHRPAANERDYRPVDASSSGLRLVTADSTSTRPREDYGLPAHETRDGVSLHRRLRSGAREDIVAAIPPYPTDVLDNIRLDTARPTTRSSQLPSLSQHGSSPFAQDTLAYRRQQSPPPRLPLPGSSSSVASIPSPFGHFNPLPGGFASGDYRNLRSPHPPLSASVYGSQPHSRTASGYSLDHQQYNPSQSPYNLIHSPLSVASQSRRSSLAEPRNYHLSTSPLHIASLHPSIYPQQLAGPSQAAAYPSVHSPFVRSSPLHSEIRSHYNPPVSHPSTSAHLPPPHLPPISSIYSGPSHGTRPNSSSSSVASAYNQFTSPPLPYQAPLPQPLRFNYTPPSPNGSSATIMPPRKKPTTASTAMSVGNNTPGTMSSTDTGASSVPKQGNGWKTERVMADGKPQEVIVLEDTHSPIPPPIPKKRTRAQAALEAAQAAQVNGVNGSTSASTSVTAVGSAKKRKVDDLASSVGSTASKKGKAKASGSTKGAGSTASQATYYQPPYQPPVTTTKAAAAPAASTPHAGPAWDDKEGHYIIKPDEMVDGRYKIIRLLGQGTFGKVVECRDVLTRRKVAIKIIRAVQKYRDASKIEVRVLQTLKAADTQNLYKCIHMDEYFDFRNHPCIVSELLGMSVFDFLKENRFQPFPERHIQDFARSLLTSVSFLHRLKLVHTDLKPENILLAENGYFTVGPRAKAARTADAPKTYNILKNTDIRLIDFGSATFENEYHSTVVSTRHYRAPEIILGLSWSYPCDMFSIGCILVEFFTGDALFQTHDNLEHLAMMEVVMGKMPTRILKAGSAKKPEFFRGANLDFPNAQTPKSSRKFVKGLQPLHKIIPPTDATNNLFLDLVLRLLDFDPQRRINVDQALVHPYFRQQIPAPVPP